MKKAATFAGFLLLTAVSASIATADPGDERHELMEGVRDAAKPVGAMLQGKADYDAGTVARSLETFAAAASTLGDLFPEGSQGGEAAPAIWEDRQGFEEAIEQWRAATDTALGASPATLADAKPVLGPVFGACKNCHDSYRIEEED